MSPTDAVRARSVLAVVPQRNNLDRSLSIRQNLLFHAAYHRVPAAERTRRADELLEMFGLADRAADKVDSALRRAGAAGHDRPGDDAHPPGALPGRAHDRPRSGRAAVRVGPDPRPARPGRDGRDHHPRHGRGDRARRAGGDHGSRPPAGARHAGGAHAQPARQDHARDRDGGSRRLARRRSAGARRAGRRRAAGAAREQRRPRAPVRHRRGAHDGRARWRRRCTPTASRFRT